MNNNMAKNKKTIILKLPSSSTSASALPVVGQKVFLNIKKDSVANVLQDRTNNLASKSQVAGPVPPKVVLRVQAKQVPEERRGGSVIKPASGEAESKAPEGGKVKPKCGNWSPTQTLELIGAIKANECLYKINHPEYLNRTLKDAAYNRIREFISGFRENTTVQEVMLKWNSLRTQFMAEHKKVKDSKKTGTGKDEVYTPSMTFYTDLLFLQEPTKIRPPKSNVSFEDGENENIDEDLLHDDLPSTSLAGPPVKKRKSKVNKNNDVDGEFIDFLKEAKSLFKPTQPPTAVAPPPAAPIAASPAKSQDEFDQLGNLVATKLRAMPIEQSKKVGSQIAAILYA